MDVAADPDSRTPTLTGHSTTASAGRVNEIEGTVSRGS
jgi:hypothetical protein